MPPDEEKGVICRLSDLAHPHTLSRRDGINLTAGCFTCKAPKDMTTNEEFYYYCTTCDVDLHNRCHLLPRKMTHPSPSTSPHSQSSKR